MSAEEFWKDDPQLFYSYRTSFINREKRELEKEDYKSWLRGLYIHNGNGLLMNSFKQFIHNIVAGFTKGKQDNSKVDTYPAKPYSELERDKEKQKIESVKEQKYKQFESDLVYFGTLKQQYIEKLKEKSKKKGV